MRIFGTLVAVLFAIAVSASASMAQTSDLVGTWTAETTIILESDDEIVEVPRVLSIVIESVHGSVVQGARTWKAETDNPGYVEEESVLEASEPFIGALSADGKTLRLVEVDDHGLMFATRIGDDQIELTYLETAPHAVAYTAIFDRQK
ncbi:MAG: hypothetical protein GY798_09475 [Hyphomicrobiales bacterium]|nr:hypothetical protein [Hyphomicrobiales bacterium]